MTLLEPFGESTTTATDLLAASTVTTFADGPLSPPTIKGRAVPLLRFPGYKTLGVLGHGSMGVVYHVRHATLNHQFAIKALRTGLTDEHRVRFAYEVEILRQLKHAGICQFIHSGFARLAEDPSNRQWPYFVLEYVPGSPLTTFADRLDCDGEARLRLLIEVCQAVEFAHHRGIVHRDLKPGNIMVNHRGRSKVLDFGIARITDLQSTLISEREGRFIGTREYASPEQLAGQVQRIGAPSDVYALGLIGAELLSTHRLAPKDEKWKHIRQIDRALFPQSRCARLLHAIQGVLDRALSRDPAERYATAGGLAHGLQAILDEWPRDGWWVRFKSRWHRHAHVPRDGAVRQALAAVLRSRIQRGVERQRSG